MQSLFNVYKNWAIYKIKYNYVKSEDNFFLFSLQAQRHFWNIVKDLWWGIFVKKLTAKNL